MGPVKRKLAYDRGLLWSTEVSYLILLLILLLQIFFVIPFATHWGDAGKVILAFFYFGILSTGIESVTNNSRNILAWLIGLFVAVLFCSEIVFSGRAVQIGSCLFFAAYNLALGTVVLIKIFSPGKITAYRITGSIVVYLLISLVFTFSYRLNFLLDGNTAFNGLRTRELGEFSYFSLTTLTTTGYGDITPASNVARSLANLEGLVGQLYPAILIARLVSLRIESARE
jgi:hypothetical protein